MQYHNMLKPLSMWVIFRPSCDMVAWNTTGQLRNLLVIQKLSGVIAAPVYDSFARWTGKVL